MQFRKWTTGPRTLVSVQSNLSASQICRTYDISGNRLLFPYSSLGEISTNVRLDRYQRDYFCSSIATLPHFGKPLPKPPLPLCHFFSENSIANLPAKWQRCPAELCLIWSGQFGYFLKSATYFGPGLKLLRNTKMFKIVSIANIIVVVFSVLIIKLKKSKMEVPHHSKLRAHVLPIVKPDF